MRIRIKSWLPFLAVLVVSLPSESSAQVLHLFGGSGDEEFMGSLTNRYDSDSVCNRYGIFGSRYNLNSIWNRYGKGSRYNTDSPWNRYGGPMLVDDEGNYYGVLSIGADSEIGRALRALYEQADGDLSELRDLFCDAISGQDVDREA